MEKWSFLDSMFFIIVTISTVGYGYQSPTNAGSKLFTVFMMFAGVIIIYTSISDLIILFFKNYRKFLIPYNFWNPKDKLRVNVIVSISSFLLIIAIGTTFIAYNEHLDLVTAFYFIAQTSMAIGYGDVALHYSSSKIFLIFYIIFSTLTLAVILDIVLTLHYKRILRRKTQDLLNNRTNLRSIIKTFDDAHHNSFSVKDDLEISDSNTGDINNIIGNDGHNKVEMKNNSKVQKIENQSILKQIENSHVQHAQYDFNFTDVARSRSTSDISGFSSNSCCPILRRTFINKYQFVLSVLEHLGTIKVERDVIPWIEKFNELDKIGCGEISLQQLEEFQAEK
eukprot:gene8268-11191_t